MPDVKFRSFQIGTTFLSLWAKGGGIMPDRQVQLWQCVSNGYKVVIKSRIVALFVFVVACILGNYGYICAQKNLN